MLKTKPAVITDVGIDMQLRNLNGETIEFTKLVVGDGVYSDSESEPEFLRKMVSLKSPKQQFGVSSISMVDNEKIVASTVITNYELEEGYTIRELGLYARIKGDPESEGLVSLSLAEIEDTFPAYDGNVVSRIISRFQFSVSDSDTIQLSYLHDPVALVEDVDAKIAVLQKEIDDATALRASLEAYGMVKLCDSEAVTDSTGLALPVTEKNASIEGTLAYKISQLNTDLLNYTNVTDNKNTFVNSGSAFVYSKAGNKVTVQCFGSVNTDISINYILCSNFPAPLFGYAALTIVNQSHGTSGALLINPSGNLFAVEEILKAGNEFSICGNYICK